MNLRSVSIRQARIDADHVIRIRHVHRRGAEWLLRIGGAAARELSRGQAGQKADSDNLRKLPPLSGEVCHVAVNDRTADRGGSRRYACR
jgi:hypothetical protein